MEYEIKRIQYSFNSLLEGHGPYSLQAFVAKDGQTLVNMSKTFETKDEFFQEIEGLIPMLTDGKEHEDET